MSELNGLARNKNLGLKVSNFFYSLESLPWINVLMPRFLNVFITTMTYFEDKDFSFKNKLCQKF